MCETYSLPLGRSDVLKRLNRWSKLVVGVFLCLFAVPASAQDGSEILQQSGVQGRLDRPSGLRRRRTDGSAARGRAVSRARSGLRARRTWPTPDAGLRAQGGYGPVSVDLWDGRHLPYADNLVNLIVAENAAQASREELLRVLAPHGVPADAAGERSGRKTSSPGRRRWTSGRTTCTVPTAIRRPRTPVVGPPQRLQWIGSPALVAAPRPHGQHDVAGLRSRPSVLHPGRRAAGVDPAAVELAADRPRRVQRDDPLETRHRSVEHAAVSAEERPGPSAPTAGGRRRSRVRHAGHRRADDGPGRGHRRDADDLRRQRVHARDRGLRRRRFPGGGHLAVAAARLAPRVDLRLGQYAASPTPDWGWHGNPRKILAYDADSGELLWKAEAPVAPCSLAADAVASRLPRRQASWSASTAARAPSCGKTEPRRPNCPCTRTPARVC